MHDSVGIRLGTSLQSAKLQLANLLQNCYFCLIQKTISNSILWLLVIKYFWPGCFAPPYLLRPGATAPLCPPPFCYATASKIYKRRAFGITVGRKEDERDEDAVNTCSGCEAGEGCSCCRLTADKTFSWMPSFWKIRGSIISKEGARCG